MQIGQGATCKNKSGDCASASSGPNPSFNISNENYNLQVVQHAMPPLPNAANYNLQVLQHAMPPLPNVANYNLQVLPRAMPPLPQAVSPLPRGHNYNLHVLPGTMTSVPQPENYNLQVLEHGLPPLSQADTTSFQQLLGLRPQQPYFYHTTQPSQVYLFS